MPVWLLFFATHDLYTYRGVADRVDEWRRIVRGVTAGAMGTAVLGFALKLEISRGWVLVSAMVALVTVSVDRSVLRAHYRRLRMQGRATRRVVVVGESDEALELVRMIQARPDLGQEVVGVVEDPTPENVLGVVALVGASGVLIARSGVTHEVLNRLVRALVAAGVHVEISTGLRDIAHTRLRARASGRFPVTYVEPIRRTGWRGAAKRSFDVTFALLGLLGTAPVLVVAAVAIKLDSPGPVLFRQQRVGRWGRPFTIYKLRTMTVDAEAQVIDLREQHGVDSPLFKLESDPRVTRVGRVLRKLSLDELPQLGNVLRNDMSLVGPRPALAAETDAWTPELFGRLDVKPGLTGMWQVSGRSRASFDDYTRLDLYYVDNWSLTCDMAIILKTVPAVLFARGAC
jgi:exopolysaccharide biosynthesis polyprenyl glycosylphosphotransferase